MIAVPTGSRYRFVLRETYTVSVDFVRITGDPVAGIEARLVKESTLEKYVATTDEKGTATFKGVKVGTYRLLSDAPGFRHLADDVVVRGGSSP